MTRTQAAERAPDPAGADDPQRQAERTLEVVMALVDGRSGGVFVVDDGRLKLFASRSIDQSALDAVESVWTREADRLRAGEPVYVPDLSVDRELAPVRRALGPAGLVVVPVLEDGETAALLYVDAEEPRFCEAHDLERLGKFARLLTRAVRPEAEPGSPDAWGAYLERTPAQDVERERLLLLLNRNEWNIARVARLMGVTRRTVYLRLQRYDIPRERVVKSRPRRPRAVHV